MQSRSWMAALTLAAGTLLVHSTQAPAAADPVVNQVRLELQISGLGRGACDVEIKPGHPGCEFPAVVKRITNPVAQSDSKVVVRLDPILARSTNADHDCAFAITIREPGKEPKTFHRGIRLTQRTSDGPIPTQSLTCYLTSPSLAAREKPAPRR